MRFFLCTLCWFLLSNLAHAQLSVSPDGRYLVGPDNKPFFWMGDTAWELFHRLNREETLVYLKNRADKGFTVIQAVVLAELDGLHSPNAYGYTPLRNDDPLQPVEAYFTHVDWVIREAEKLGLYIGLLPTWGDKIFKDSWGTGPEIFRTDNARAYGNWLGKRYAGHKNIIWILGGDRNPRNETDLAVWRAMATGIEAGCGGGDKALMTFHPQPNGLADGGSARWFHNDAWLDFNMFQTGHCRENQLRERISVAYNRKPVKPVVNGEPIYEDHPVCFNARDLGTSSAYDVRMQAWLSVFAGATGHTYGCHGVWQMYDSGRTPVNGPHFTWKKSLDLPAAGQMRYLRHLLMSRPMQERGPAQDLLLDAGTESSRIQCLRGPDHILVYAAQGGQIRLKLPHAATWRGWWYDPRNGKSKEAVLKAVTEGLEAESPGAGYGQDWVLILDAAPSDYPDPAFQR